MDQGVLVNHLKKIINKFDEDGKQFILVMLIPADPGLINTKYTLLFSAEWLDSDSPKDAVNLIIKAIIDQIVSPNSPEFGQISRVTVIKTVDPFVKAVIYYSKVNNNWANISNFNINGIQVESGIILAAHHPVVKGTPKKKAWE